MAAARESPAAGPETPAAFAGGRGGIDCKTRPVALTLSVEAYPLSYWIPVRPRVLAGVGFYRSEVRRFNEFGDALFDDTESDGGYHAGVGLDIDLRRLSSETRVMLNLEGRWIFTEEEEDVDEVRPDGVQYTIGVKFQF